MQLLIQVGAVNNDSHSLKSTITAGILAKLLEAVVDVGAVTKSATARLVALGVSGR